MEDEVGDYRTHITEERYRSMLGEHIQKYKRRFRDSSSTPAPVRVGIPVSKSNLGGSKSGRLGNEQRGGFQDIEPDWLNDFSSQKPGNYLEADVTPKYDTYTHFNFNIQLLLTVYLLFSSL